MKKYQVKENNITKIIIGLCVIIFLYIFYDVLIRQNPDREKVIETRIEAKIEVVNEKTDKILKIVEERIVQTKNNPLFPDDADSIKNEEVVTVKENLNKLKEETFEEE